MHHEQFIQEQTLIDDSYRLGVKIHNSGFRPSFIVGLWRGGSSVGIVVQECLQFLGLETNHISIRTSYSGADSYQKMIDNPEAGIRIHGTQYLLENLNADDALLIVDDVFSSGLTTSAVIRRLKSRLKLNMPGDVRVATLWYKPSKNLTDRAPDYHLHQTNDWLVMPYELNGLSRDDISANKSHMIPILDSVKLK